MLGGLKLDMTADGWEEEENRYLREPEVDEMPGEEGSYLAPKRQKRARAGSGRRSPGKIVSER